MGRSPSSPSRRTGRPGRSTVDMAGTRSAGGRERGGMTGRSLGGHVRGAEVERLARLLEQVTPFSVLHPDDLQGLARHGRARVYRRGEVIFRTGEPARTLYVIERGQVKLFTTA